MAGTNLSFPYDSEIFNYNWENTPDIILTSMIESGAVVVDSEIATLISNGSNYFTVPYYDVLGGDEQDYNGTTDFTYDELSGGTYSGCVYGRMKAFKAISFIKDFNSGADPMAQIVNGVAKYWIKKRQERLVKLLSAIFGITGDAEFAEHITDLTQDGGKQITSITATAGATSAGNITLTLTSADIAGSPKAITVPLLITDTTVTKVATAIKTVLNADTDFSASFVATSAVGKVTITSTEIRAFDSTMNISFVDTGSTSAVVGASVDDTVEVIVGTDNLIGETTVSDATVKANGDNAGEYTLAIMHSVIANRLSNLQLLNYSKYTDASGITRNLPIGTINGLTVIVNDNVPKVGSEIEGYYEYTTFVLGNGAIKYAPASVDSPSAMVRDEELNGGTDMVYTRKRECFAPNGFSFIGDVTTDVAIPDSVLLASASWERKMPAKSVNMCEIVTNG